MRALIVTLALAAAAFGCVPAGGGRLSCDRTGTACTLEP
jgi:hypothetical protein